MKYAIILSLPPPIRRSSPYSSNPHSCLIPAAHAVCHHERGYVCKVHRMIVATRKGALQQQKQLLSFTFLAESFVECNPGGHEQN